MNSSTARFTIAYLQLIAGITAVIGLVLLLWPEWILKWFIPGATGVFFVRFIGSALLGYATLNVLSSKVNNYDIRRIAIDANLVTLTVALILSVVGVVSGAITHDQLLLIGEHVVFVTGFVVARFANQKTK